MQIFRNGALLFRAEWDNVDESKTIHPQPHWHIEPVTMFNGSEVQIDVKELFEEYLKDESSAFQEDSFMSSIEKGSGSNPMISAFRYHDFHFAMSSEWHKGTNRCNVALDETSLKNWLRQCLESINSQLNNIGY